MTQSLVEAFRAAFYSFPHRQPTLSVFPHPVGLSIYDGWLIMYDTPRTLRTSWGTQAIDYPWAKLDTNMPHKLRPQGFRMLRKKKTLFLFSLCLFIPPSPPCCSLSLARSCSLSLFLSLSYARTFCFSCFSLYSLSLCPRLLREFLLFLCYHVPQKDGRREWQKKPKVPKYPKNSMRNCQVDGIEDVSWKADYMMKVRKNS